MVRRSAPGNWRGLGPRTASALALAPPVLGLFYLGPPYSDLLVLAGGGIAAWEWSRICHGATLDLAGGLIVGSVLAAVAAGALGHYSAAGWLIAVGAMGALVAASRDGRSGASWSGLGVVYLASGCLALLWLRQEPAHGRFLVFWLLAVVWSTDIGAYFAGRGFGGPKLAPSISPKKTWAGLCGGALAAAVVGLVAAQLSEGSYLRWSVLSAALAIIAQVGDLFESGLKRRFAVKDASALIPGHGGLLDRIDGLIAAALMLGGFLWLSGA